MHHGNATLYESAVAPSPVIPISRPTPLPSSKKKRYGITAMTLKQYDSTPPPTPRLEAASTKSITKTQNQNVVELVRAPQSQDAPLQAAAPPMGALEVLKAGHRRIWQFAQRQMKYSHDSNKAVLVSRQPSVSRRASCQLGTARDSTQSKSKQDIGQLCLEDDTVGRKESQDENAGRMASLDFGDFIAMLTPRPSEPPPSPSRAVSQDSAQQSWARKESCAETLAVSEQDFGKGETAGVPTVSDKGRTVNSQSAAVPVSSTAERSHPEEGNFLEGDDAKRLAILLHAMETGRHGEQDQEKSKAEPGAARISTTSTLSSATTVQTPSSTITEHLKLFPSPGSFAPQRVSSNNALNRSNRRLQASKAVVSPPVSPKSLSSVNSEPVSKSPQLSSDALLSIVNLFPSPPCSISSSPRQSMRLRGILSANALSSHCKNNSPSPSSPMGTIPALPPPPPRKPLPPLPTLPLVGAADLGGGANPRQLMPQTSTQSLRFQRSLDFNRQVASTCSSPTRAQICQTRSATSLRTASPTLQGPVKTPAPKPSNASLAERRLNDQAERVRALRLKDISESRLHSEEKDQVNSEESPGLPEWLLFPPLPSPSIQVRQPTGPRDVKRTANVGKRFARNVALDSPSPPPRSPLPPLFPCSPRSTHTFRSASPNSAGVYKETELNARKLHNRPGSPAVSSDTQVLGTGVWSSGPHKSSDRPRDKGQVRQIPHATDPNDTPYVRKPGHPNYTAPLPLQSRGSHDSSSSPSRHAQHTQCISNAQDSQTNHQPHTFRELESRIAQLEHQNEILRAALLATFSVGPNFDHAGYLRRGPEPALFPSANSRSEKSLLPLEKNHYSSSIRNQASPVPVRPKTGGGNGNSQRNDNKLSPSSGSWVGSSLRNSFDSCSSSASVRDVEDMMVNLDIDWMAEGLMTLV